MHSHIVYSPKGEKFEVSKANFDDLTKHYHWTPTPPSTSVAALVAAEPKEPADGEGQDSAAVLEERRSEEGSSEGREGASDAAEEGTSEEEVKLDEKAALIADLKSKFDFDADKRWNVTKLKLKLDELAAAAAA